MTKLIIKGVECRVVPEELLAKYKALTSKELSTAYSSATSDLTDKVARLIEAVDALLSRGDFWLSANAASAELPGEYDTLIDALSALLDQPR